MAVLDFMLAHFMEETPQFERLNRGLRSVALSYAGDIESTYSMWNGNKYGCIYTLPGADLPKMAHVSAINRLLDVVFSLGSFTKAYDFFRRFLNPFDRYPIQFLYNMIIKNSKTLLQEYMQYFFHRLPRYDVSQIAGEAHNPIYRCVVSFESYKFEAQGTTKSAAEGEAGRKAVKYMLKHDNGKISPIITKKLSGGMVRSRGRAFTYRNTAGTLGRLRMALGVSCPDQALLRCLTLRADSSQYIVSDWDTGENLSLCGSQLARIFEAEELAKTANVYLTFRQEVGQIITSARNKIYPRTRDQLSAKIYADIVQALLYAEFVYSGFDAAKNIFARVTSTGVRYTTLLQGLTQRLGRQLPDYEYFAVDPTAHAPIYRCRATFNGIVGEGVGRTKQQARNHAAQVLLAKLLKVQGDEGSSQG